MFAELCFKFHGICVEVFQGGFFGDIDQARSQEGHWLLAIAERIWFWDQDVAFEPAEPAGDDEVFLAGFGCVMNLGQLEFETGGAFGAELSGEQMNGPGFFVFDGVHNILEGHHGWVKISILNLF